MSRFMNRPAFTLIELVMVMGILAVLTGLTLCAVQKARESANRASCTNNMRQIGLALSQYHNDSGSLPPGLSMRHNTQTSAMSWEAFIVPYLEQAALAKKIRDAVPNIRAGNVPNFLFATVISVYGCPSDAFSKSPHDVFAGLGLVSFTSYLGVDGTSLFRKNGCLYEDSEVSWTDISDGTSNTLLVGERPAAAAAPCFSIWYTGLWGDGTAWPTGQGSQMMESATTCSSVLGARDVLIHPGRGCKHEPAHFGPGRLGNVCDFSHFWSLHGSGANFLFADGSVRFLSYASDVVLPALATRAGGEIIGDY
jgi:prepilin-type processing-associated H-X9-DG protein/prepilin-type N-terminal cleavage/methylation domain-containing protein